MTEILYGSVPLGDSLAASRYAASPYAQPLVRTARPQPRPHSAATTGSLSPTHAPPPRGRPPPPADLSRKLADDDDDDGDEFDIAVQRATNHQLAVVRGARGATCQSWRLLACGV